MNPIVTINGIAVVSPTTFTWKLEDLSSPDAGRTEDGTMQKMKIGQIRSIELAWRSLTTAQVKAVLTAFNAEYITVVYLDPLVGGNRTAVFYVGNRSVPLFNMKLDRWENISFNIIERSVA